MSNARHRNLIIVRAGNQSLHHQWLLPDSARNFDLLISAYDREVEEPEAPGVRRVHIPGPKVSGWAKTLRLEDAYIAQYSRVALVDDDILATAEDLSRCFDLGEELGFDIWQPALSIGSHFSFAGTLANPLLSVRNVNFVEMMCPFFTIESLSAASQLFEYGFETGIDLVWCSIVGRKGRFGILDAVQVEHTRPVTLESHLNGFVGGRYEDHIYACLSYFSLPWPSLVASSSVSCNGRQLGKSLTTLASVAFMLSMLPASSGYRRRNILVHIKHQIFRKTQFGIHVRQILRRDALAGRSQPLLQVTSTP